VSGWTNRSRGRGNAGVVQLNNIQQVRVAEGLDDVTTQRMQEALDYGPMDFLS
jgi:hypothetical protein